MDKIRWINTYLNLWRILPVYFFLNTNRFKEKSKKDLEAWIANSPIINGHSRIICFGYLLLNQKSCRNIFLNRLHRNPIMFVITRILFKPLDSFFINVPPEKIGGGFSVQHGFSTIIAAKEIGERFRVFQQVTVGYNGDESPVIGDDVVITAGAIVIGNVKIGNGAVVGANSVVTHDVEEGVTVAGVPAKVIKR